MSVRLQVNPAPAAAAPSALRAAWVRTAFTLQMAWVGIFANPLRSVLTALSVVIGVATVVSLIGIGEGARQSVVAQFASLGENVIIIETLDPSLQFRPGLAEELLTRVETLEYATPVIQTEAPVRWRRARGVVEVVGVNEQFPQIRDHPMAAGRFFTDLHVQQRSRVAVLGHGLAVRLMGGRSPVGNTITIDGRAFRIIGVLAPKGADRAGGIDEKIVVPVTVAQQIARQRAADQIWAKADSPEAAELAVAQLGRIFRREVGLDPRAPDPGSDDPGGEPGGPGGGGGRVPGGEPMPPPPTDGGPAEPGGPSAPGGELGLGRTEELVAVTSLNQMVEEADRANRVMTLMLGGIAAVSLLVGGIGIMNIMLVSVSERTSEIGLRKALGARRTDLLAQFLAEALMLSASGGVVGLGLALVGHDVTRRFGLEAVITPASAVTAMGLAVGVGIIFGVYPAWLASGLQPAEALRRH